MSNRREGVLSGGGEADGTDFAGAMAQRVFRTIGSAADDVKAVFGDDAADLAAQFLVWALAETERCALSVWVMWRTSVMRTGRYNRGGNPMTIGCSSRLLQSCGIWLALGSVYSVLNARLRL